MIKVLVIAEHDESQLATGTLNVIGAASAMSPECVDVAVPSSSVAPWSVCVTGSGVEWPRLTDVSFCSCTPENVEEP